MVTLTRPNTIKKYFTLILLGLIYQEYLLTLKASLLVEYRGRGLAGKLAREAFNHIIAEKATVTLSCTYLQ